jgi:hypothetical protein
MQKPKLSLPYAADLTLLQVTTTALMTRFYAQGCPGLANAVVHHLETLLRHPEIQASPLASEGYGSLLQQWGTILEMTREAAAKQRLINESNAYAAKAASLH